MKTLPRVATIHVSSFVYPHSANILQLIRPVPLQDTEDHNIEE